MKGDASYLALTWVSPAFAFIVDVVIVARIPAGHSANRYAGGLGSILVLLFGLGVQSVAWPLLSGAHRGSRASLPSRPLR